MLAFLNLFLKVIPAVAGLLDTIAQAWQRWEMRKAGRDEQRVADLSKSLEAEGERKNVDVVVGAANVSEHQRMLDRWTRR